MLFLSACLRARTGRSAHSLALRLPSDGLSRKRPPLQARDLTLGKQCVQQAVQQAVDKISSCMIE